MQIPRRFFERLDSMAGRASRLRYGRLRARGVPAILCGAATIVLAAGLSAALQKATVALPEVLREARFLWLAVRGERRDALPGPTK
ncbi:MAG: hypothetical protein IAI49_11090 [Candidatus Eremiobacteraeota bacterium]|nr:hypothetical protein [Candidatus Eremiobacteraeota bacterium]